MLGERGEIRLDGGNLLLRPNDHVDVLHAVVVELDRQLGALDAQRPQEAVRIGPGLDRGQRLLHAAEHDPRTFALEPDRNDACSGLEPDLVQLQRAAQHECGAKRRVSGEGQLGRRREDPDPRVSLVGRQDEHRLAQVHLAGERLEHLLGYLARVGENGEAVALERRVREDVDQHVTEPHARPFDSMRATIASRPGRASGRGRAASSARRARAR
jgi:hypothetical protein